MCRERELPEYRWVSHFSYLRYKFTLVSIPYNITLMCLARQIKKEWKAGSKDCNNIINKSKKRTYFQNIYT